MTQCLADWLMKWDQDDAAARTADVEKGLTAKPEALLVYKRARVSNTKKAWRRIGASLGVEGFSQKASDTS